MALVRILIDGYSLLHEWLELAPGKPRHSAAAREELIWVLTQYHDATGIPLSVFFDGSMPAISAAPAAESTAEVEILYSRAGQTADQMIERAAHRFRPYGEVLAVTDDIAERDTVVNLDGLTSSCRNFVQTIENALTELRKDIRQHNRQEKNHFNRRA